MKLRICINKNKIKLEKKNGKINIVKDKIKISKDTTSASLKVGQICEDLALQRRYFISDVCKEFYECLDINYMKRGIFKSKYFLKKDVVLSNNQSLDGIKWFEENPSFNLEETYKNEIIDCILNSQQRYLNNNKEKVKIYK